MDEEQDYITLIDEDGNEELFDILFAFDETEKYNKRYIYVVAAGSEDEDEVDIQAFSSDIADTEVTDEGTLDMIEDENEWKMVEERLNQWLEENEEDE